MSTAGRITLWGIEVFVATAEEQSVSAAARRLGASASAVSQQISNLEAAVGATLLNRNARPVTLTPSGEILRRHATVILNEAAAARAAIAGQDMSRLTRFRLGMIEDFEADVTPRLLRQMADALRDCQFVLDTGPSHRLFDLLETRALDMIVAADTGALIEGMEVHPLLSEPFVAAVPKGCVPEGAELFEALSAVPFIQYTARHYMGRVIASHLARQNISLPHRFELDSYQAIMAMVASGQGWTILTPLGLMRAQRFREATDVLPLPIRPLTRTISLVVRNGGFRELPEQVASGLRGLLQERVVAPSLESMPWAASDLRVL